MMTAGFHRNFLSLCVFDLGVRLLHPFADDQGRALLTIWSGPISTILFSVVALEGLLWFFDPEKLERPKDDSVASGPNLIYLGRSFLRASGWTKRLVGGSRSALPALSCAAVLTATWSFLVPSPVVGILDRFVQDHLVALLSVSLFGVCLLRLAGRLKSVTSWGKAGLLGGFCLLVPAWCQGRLEDCVFHLLQAPESLLAWSYAVSWSVLFAQGDKIEP